MTKVKRDGSTRSNPAAVAKATTAERKILIGGRDDPNAPVVRFKLPKEMVSMVGGGFFFGKSLGPGRWLNHHAFIDGAQPEQSIIARLEIWDRVMSDGVRHANIDLTPAAAEAEPTHKLVCYFQPTTVPAELPENALSFDLHNGGGKLVLLPL